MVFAGYGIRARNSAHDDFEGDALRGKIALVFDHEPGEKDPESAFDGAVTSEYSRRPSEGSLRAERRRPRHPVRRRRAQSSRRDRFHRDSPSRTGRDSATYAAALRSRAGRTRCGFRRSRSPLGRSAILEPTGKTLEELARLSEVTGSGSSSRSRAKVALTASVAQQALTDRNVVAAIEGSDARLKDEWVVVCAHYDHDGADDQRVFNGADDDGSGTVALLAIAEAYAEAARQGARPRGVCSSPRGIPKNGSSERGLTPKARWFLSSGPSRLSTWT